MAIQKPILSFFMSFFLFFISSIAHPQQPEFNALLAKESAAIETTEGRVSRVGPNLIIQTLKNEEVFSDNLSESESAAKYIYIRNFLKNKYHLIYVSGWEGHSFQLVQATTGRSTRLDGFPILSPDSKFFVATSMDLEAGYNNNSIQICELTLSGPKVVFYHNFKDSCGPSNPKWVDNKTILFDINIPVQRDPEFKTRRVTAKIMQRDQSWIIK